MSYILENVVILTVKEAKKEIKYHKDRIALLRNLIKNRKKK